MSPNIIPIFYACDDNFVKYTIVSIKSMIENASDEEKYIIYILNTGVTPEMKSKTEGLANANFEIQFVDVTDYLKSINDKLPLRDYYSKTTYYRLFIAEMFPQYNKAIYIDSDTVVLGDVSELYNHDLLDNYVGAANEQVMVQVETYGEYVEKVLGISRFAFFNAGVLLINCDQFRKHQVLDQFIKLLHTYNFVVTQDEDYLNLICKDKVLWLEQGWNTEVFGNIPVPDSEIKVLHYIMVSKPWHYKDCRYASYFWEYASMTSVYKEITDVLNNYTEEERKRDVDVCDNLLKLAFKEIDRDDNYLKRLRKKQASDRVEIIQKIEQYEMEGRFDEDVELDPPGRELLPDDIDYLRGGIISKIKTKFAFSVARKFVNEIIENKQMIIRDIVGIEHFKSLRSGAIITCNHFNAFDSFAIQLAYDASEQKGRKFYRVIREGNYTSFPGFYGFLMKNCNTLPLSSNLKTMEKFVKATDKLLTDGHFILVYPEQSMWWNYKKPKPLKNGAFKFASRNNVPVLPCFITMKDSDILGEDGFYIQEYTINIAPPIYPDPNKSQSENIDTMKKQNYLVWKEIYEKTYNIPLIYQCKKDDLEEFNEILTNKINNKPCAY